MVVERGERRSAVAVGLPAISGAAGVWACWIASRAVLLGLFGSPAWLTYLSDAPVRAVGRHLTHDVRVYSGWSKVLLGGGFPADERWQYPSLAAPIVAAPRLLGFLEYRDAFMLLALVADLSVLVLLLRRGRRRAGAWTWVGGIFLLGGVVHLRYDLFVTVFAVAALLALPRRWLFGALAGVGAMLKLWPALLLAGLVRDRRAFGAVAAFAGVVAVVLAAGEWFGSGQFGFLGGQRGRGMEVEAVAVSPWQVARLAGYPVKVVHEYGCAQFTGPGLGVVALGCQAATLGGLALVALLAWRRGWSPAAACDVALAAVLVAVVTSRVLSPQYMIWLVGLAAAVMAFPGRRPRAVVVMVLCAALLTQVVFPVGWDGLLARSPEPVAVLALVARNALLLAATGTALWWLWRERPS